MSRPFTLHPSPLTVLRDRNKLTMEQAAQKLGVCTLKVARIEKATRRIPVCTRRRMSAALNPPPKYHQISIFEYLAEIGDGGGQNG